MRQNKNTKIIYFISIISFLALILLSDIILSIFNVFPYLYSKECTETYMLYIILTVSALTAVLDINLSGKNYLLTNYVLPTIILVYLTASGICAYHMERQIGFTYYLIISLVTVFLIVLSRFVLNPFVFDKLEKRRYSYHIALVIWYVILLTSMMITSFYVLY